MSRIFQIASVLILSLLPGFLTAQSAQIAFGNSAQDSNLPVEVNADNLAVDQSTGTAVFTGNVLIVQGEMRLSAERVLVNYYEDQSGIESLEATGNVTLVSGSDAAESRQANYDIDSGRIEMNGDVVLVQGSTTLAAEKMIVSTKDGTAQMSGRVRTVLQPQSEN